MCMDAPAPPPIPDPYETAGAQAQSDINTAIANNHMNNANVYSPFGSSTFNRIPGSGITITLPDGSTKKVFQYEQHVNLSPEQQKLYNQQTRLGQDVNRLAIGQVDRLGDVLSEPVSFDGAPKLQSNLKPADFRQFTTEFDNAGRIQRSVGADDFSADRQRVEEALMSRLNPQIERDRDALETKLLNQGLARDSEAFRDAIDEVNRSATDARMQAILAGGQEQSRMFGMDLSQGQFANTAQQQAYDQARGRGEFENSGISANNAIQQQRFNNRQTAANFQNQARQQSIQEMLAERNQPINEISTLMGKGQVSMPQFASFQGSSMAPPPVAQSVYNSAALANQQYGQQMSGYNAGLGGMYGLGSTALYGLMMSDRRLKERIADTGMRAANGLKFYAYSYLGEAKRHIGLLADEVAGIVPDAVRNVGGYLAVDYPKALEAR